jgi:hypothetical protein
MAARVHRQLKVVAFHAGGKATITVNSCKTYIQIQLCSQKHVSEPMTGFFIPNYQFYRTDRFPGRTGIPHNHAGLCYMCDTCT